MVANKNISVTKVIYTVIHTIRFSVQQAESLQKLKDYDVNISQFIRLAISEKIKRDWKQIKEML